MEVETVATAGRRRQAVAGGDASKRARR